MLPKDPYILMSVLSTRLRDNDITLSELIKSEGADFDEITKSLYQIGYQYDEKSNTLRRI